MKNLTEPNVSLTESDIEKIFNEIDSDGNGYITPREAKKAFKKISARFGLYSKVFIGINSIFGMLAKISIGA
jgi:hypothetical protein